jgi:hypothetical protein
MRRYEDMLKITVDERMFVSMFDKWNRSENFSIAGLRALFDWFNQIEEEIELDIIAICCGFSEYKDMEEFRADYGDGYSTLEDVANETLVIPIPGGESFIIRVF